MGLIALVCSARLGTTRLAWPSLALPALTWPGHGPKATESGSQLPVRAAAGPCRAELCRAEPSQSLR